MDVFIKRSLLSVCIVLFLLTTTESIVAQERPLFKNTDIMGLAVKSNLLMDIAVTPNIGIEMMLRERVALNFNWFYAWWSNSKDHRFWRTYGGMFEARKWFGSRADRHMFEGHHLGAYFMGGTFDFEFGNKGYQSPFAVNTGICYGYGVKLHKRLYLDFVIGIGYLGGSFDKYKVQNGSYCIYKQDCLNYWGPALAEISLVWSLNGLLKQK